MSFATREKDDLSDQREYHEYHIIKHDNRHDNDWNDAVNAMITDFSITTE